MSLEKKNNIYNDTTYFIVFSRNLYVIYIDQSRLNDARKSDKYVNDVLSRFCDVCRRSRVFSDRLTEFQSVYRNANAASTHIILFSRFACLVIDYSVGTSKDPRWVGWRLEGV